MPYDAKAVFIAALSELDVVAKEGRRIIAKKEQNEQYYRTTFSNISFSLLKVSRSFTFLMRSGGALDAETYERQNQVLRQAESSMTSLEINIRDFDRVDRRDAAKYKYLNTNIPKMLKYLEDVDSD